MGFDTLSKEEKLELLKLLDQKELLKKERVLDTVQLHPKQLEFHKSPARIRLFCGGNACHPAGTKVLMYDGTLKAVEEIKIGDQLMGPDSTPRNVLELHTGTQQMYEVWHKSLRSIEKVYEANEDHILSLKYCSADMKYGKNKYDVTNISIKDYLTKSNSFKHLHMGYRVPIEFKESPVPIDPYLLGTWLGDGNSHNAAITNMDDGILNLWIEAAKKVNSNYQFKPAGNAVTLTLMGRNVLVEQLRELGLIKNKHVPQQYKSNSRKVRLELLAGLLDTDGYLAPHGPTFEITQKNKVLADDIAFLARSLGFRVSIKSCQKGCQTGAVGTYNRIHISGHVGEIPTRVLYKKALKKYTNEKNPLHYSIELKKSEVKPYFGFSLDKDQLYVLEDFSVTHNSGKTFTALHELVQTHLKTHPYRNVDQIYHTWFIVSDFKKVPDYIRELRKVCPPSKFPEEDRLGTPNVRRLVWKDGGTTTFYSHEQDPFILEGMSFDSLWVDESCPRDLYIAAYRGLRNNPQHFVSMTLTPINEPWLYTDIYQPGVNKENPEIEVFVSTVYENSQNLDAAWLKQFEGSLTEEEKKVRLYGEFASLQGRVFKEFSRTTHVIRQKPWPRDWPVYLCVDPHTRKKSVAVWIGVTKDEELVVLDEKEEDDIISLGMTINELEKQRKYRVVKRIIDNSGSSRDWSGSTAVELLRTKCNLSMVPVTNEEKDVDESLFRIKQLLRVEELPDGRKEPKLYFMEHCKNTITEMELYGWHENRNSESRGTSERVKKVYDDHIDPIRYIVMTRPKHAFNYDVIQYSSGYSKSRGPASRSTLKNKLFGD